MKKLSSLVALSVIFATSAYCQSVKPKKDVLAEPTTSGSIVGRVYDLENMKPLKGVTVVIMQDGAFSEKGQTIGITNDFGEFKTKAILGRISSNVDVGRLLTTSLIGLLAGAATNTTKRVDVTRFVVRASAPGYKVFEGVVKTRSTNAENFQANLEPIVLAKDENKFVSTSVPDWGIVGISEFTVSPQIAKPGTKIQFTVKIELPIGSEDHIAEVGLTSRLWKGMKTLKRDSPKVSRNLIFVGEHTFGKKEKPRAEEVTAHILKSTYDCIEGKDTVVRLIQVSNEGESDPIAQTRLEVLSLLGSNSIAPAIERLKSLYDLPSATLFDCEYLAWLSESQGNLDVASSAQIKRMSLMPDAEKPLALASYARVLLASEHFPEIVTLMESLRKSIPAKDQVKKLPASSFGALGLSYVKLSKFEEAKKLNTEMAKMNAPGFAINPLVIEFRTTLRVMDIEEAIKKNPSDAKLYADYGRAMLDQERYEEAIPKLQESLRLDPNAGAVKRDYYYAILRLQGQKIRTEVPLDDAILAAKASAELDGKSKSKDFFTWKSYALLLYQKYVRSEPDKQKEIHEQLLTALRESIKIGRTGAVQDPGISYYFGGWVPLTGSEVRINGFAYPEAYQIFLMLESLKLLATNKDDYWANYNLATALLDLNLAGEAASIVAKVSELRPDSPDSLFLDASCLYRQSNYENAASKLRTALNLNPLHPTANLLLAESLTRLGDTVGAAAALVEHARWYPKPLLRPQ